MRILYMGTPEISATVLERLIADGKEIIAVITAEDKPRGRGKQIMPTPTKAMAEKYSIPTYTPSSLRTEEFMGILRELMPELIVVVAYGKILPPEVLDFPRLGCINLHVSLLPKYRGAAPMQRAVMAGESETGVTVMYMAEGLDTGDIISVRKFPIGSEDTFETVHDNSAKIGGELLSETVDDIEAGRAGRIKQDDTLATYAKKVEKSEAHIDLSKSARELDCIIRGMTPIPGAYVIHRDKMLKIAKARPTSGSGRVGEVIATDAVADGSFTIATGDGALTVLSVIPEGKGKMTAGDFLRGRKIEKGDILR